MWWFDVIHWENVKDLLKNHRWGMGWGSHWPNPWVPLVRGKNHRTKESGEEKMFATGPRLHPIL